jgi:hypothetical protein
MASHDADLDAASGVTNGLSDNTAWRTREKGPTKNPIVAAPV